MYKVRTLSGILKNLGESLLLDCFHKVEGGLFYKHELQHQKRGER